MLRYPPSRISLTASDVHGLEQRLAARQSNRLARPKSSNVRLSPGPAHATRLSFVSAEDNVGRKRARSSSSEATFYDSSFPPGEGAAVASASNITDTWIAGTPSNVQQHPRDHSSLCHEAVRALESVVAQQQSPAMPTPRRAVDSFYHTDQQAPAAEEDRTDPKPFNSSLDGVLEVPLSHTFIHENPSIPTTRRGGQVLGELNNYAHPVERIPRTEPRPRPCSRFRRRNVQSQDIPIYHDSQSLQEFLYASHTGTADAYVQNAAPAQNSAPRIVFPLDDGQWASNPALDPAAPVFVPRTRFGTVTGSSAEGDIIVAGPSPQWGSLDSTREFSNLRILSSSEQNVDVLLRLRQDNALDNDARNAQQSLQRSRSRTTDQNTFIPPPAPHLERYPLMRPPSGLAVPRQPGGVAHLSPGAPSASLQPRTSGTHHAQPARPLERPQSQLHARHLLLQSDESVVGAQAQLRSASPALSTSSRSTPNLLQPAYAPPRIDSRTSSLSWTQTASRTPSFHRVPSMVSAASGVSGGRAGSAVTTRQSSRESLDAAIEFLRMRNSPLDDLTERLSRLSTSRPRSVGRSWERPPNNRSRVSLLSGDPFRQEPSSSESPVTFPPMIPDFPSDPSEQSIPEELEPVAEDPVALALALPPSSPLPASFTSATISLPPLPTIDTSSPRSPLAQRSPPKIFCSPEGAIKRKPVPNMAATPRVKVYDDEKPPETQPITPADIARSRRAKIRSDTAVQKPPTVVGRVMVSSPPPIPERPLYRNTYPSVTVSQGSTQLVQISPSNPEPGASTSTQAARNARARAGRQSQRTSEQAENDAQGQLHHLEEDRRTWLARHEDGSLDVTPPREGRFERYLS